MRVVVLLSKDPVTTHGGDLTLSRELMRIIDEEHDLTCLSLSPDVTEVTHDEGLVRVPKPSASAARVGLASVRHRRSLVHARYLDPAYVAELDRLDADLYLADHSYMGEPFLRSRWAREGRPLLVNTVISESFVWGETRGLLGRLQRRAIVRDEMRVARAARSLATYDADEAASYRLAGVDARWLNLTLPPREAVDVAATGRRLAFVGERAWPPNQEAFERVVAWWPEIAEGIDDAELCVAGNPHRAVALPPGVRDLGFVDDLDAFLATCRGGLAPVSTGGGVRVKILDAASRGLPMVATSAAVGSLADVFDVACHDDRASFVAAARRLLLEPEAAAAEGARLHALNARRWDERVVHDEVLSWVES